VSDGTFLAYVALLGVSGVLLLVLAIGGFGQKAGIRVIDGMFGLGFLAYSVYLFFFFEGGTVRIFFYAFVVPVLAVVHAVKARRAERELQTAPHYPYGQQLNATGYPLQPAGPGQPFGYPAPSIATPEPQQPGYPDPVTRPSSPGQ